MRRQSGPGAVSFRCPACIPDTSVPAVHLRLENPVLADVVGDLVRPTAILARARDWVRRYFAAGAGEDAACTRCGGRVRLATYVRRGGGDHGPNGLGLYAECGACGEVVSSSLGGLALARPEVRRLHVDHPRTRALPPRAVEYGGAPALVVRHEDVLGSAGVDVVFARDTLGVLDVRGTTT